MAEFNPTWWQTQNTDPLYLQQVADVFGQLPGNNAAFRNPALRAITQQGAIGNDPSGFIAKLNEAFRGRNIASPFSSDELAQAATAAQQLNEGELSDSGQIERRLSDRNRSETNDLAARGILQSGENAYRAGERNLLRNQLNYSSFQGLLDQIEGFNAGRLAAEQAHKQNLWKYLESATGRMSAAEAARRAALTGNAKAADDNSKKIEDMGDKVEYPSQTALPPGFPDFAPPPNYIPGSENVPSTTAQAQTGMPAFKTPPPGPPPPPKPPAPYKPPTPSWANNITPYKPPAPPKPKPLPKVSGAYASPAFATTLYRSLAGRV